ncbi:MAG: hypothetical protein SVS85_03335 [Candidatus Nanohaloarchaea archaeon]|nr:hypothetical protein [Candidatus Nanohaloarchaea archaeon]
MKLNCVPDEHWSNAADAWSPLLQCWLLDVPEYSLCVGCWSDAIQNEPNSETQVTVPPCCIVTVDGWNPEPVYVTVVVFTGLSAGPDVSSDGFEGPEEAQPEAITASAMTNSTLEFMIVS